MMGSNVKILVFWMLSFKQTFSLSPFIFIKRLFCSSLLFAISVMSWFKLQIYFLLNLCYSSFIFCLYFSFPKLFVMNCVFLLTRITCVYRFRSWHLVPSLHGRYMGKQWKQYETLYFGAPKSLKMLITAMKLKDAYSLEEKFWPT